ncbi:unnamed protein product, partial [Polarella glacialis]
ACAAGQQSLQALVLLDEFQAKDVQLDIISWNAALAACEVSGLWQQAIRILDTMALERLQPGAVALGATAGACERAADPQHFPQLVTELRDSCSMTLEIDHRQEDKAAGRLTDILAAEEFLASYGAVGSKLEAALSVVLYQPVFPRLASLCGFRDVRQRPSQSCLAAEAPGPARDSRLHDTLLERQFTLGGALTAAALLGLQLCALGGAHSHWKCCAAAASRRDFVETGGQSTGATGPAAQSLPGWLAAAIVLAGEPCRGRVAGYGAATGPLLPVFVHHDRSKHAERQAWSLHSPQTPTM